MVENKLDEKAFVSNKMDEVCVEDLLIMTFAIVFVAAESNSTFLNQPIPSMLTIYAYSYTSSNPGGS